MAEQQAEQQGEQESAQDGAALEQGQVGEGKKSDVLKRFMTWKWLAILLAASIGLHGMTYGYYKLFGNSERNVADAEVALGTFSFLADDKERGPVDNAEFNLHIALLDHVDVLARQRLEARKFRIRQDVEELLRQAHGGDFEDPNLVELKRQIQERINETLGVRSVADVIVTDLKLGRKTGRGNKSAETVGSTPWVDKLSDKSS